MPSFCSLQGQDSIPPITLRLSSVPGGRVGNPSLQRKMSRLQAGGSSYLYYRIPMTAFSWPISVIPLIRFFFIDIYNNLQIVSDTCYKIIIFKLAADLGQHLAVSSHGLGQILHHRHVNIHLLLKIGCGQAV